MTETADGVALLRAKSKFEKLLIFTGHGDFATFGAPAELKRPVRVYSVNTARINIYRFYFVMLRRKSIDGPLARGG